MKLYTRTGDNGTTGIFGGERTRKSDPRLDCCGTVDELNAHIGLAAAGAGGPLLEDLRLVQHELFVVGSHLATPADGPATQHLPPLDEGSIGRLETQIDAVETQLAPLSNFILPGGSEMAARLHVARTVCRRAERRTVGFSTDRPIHPLIVPYLNRLGDWLFAMARLANHAAGTADIVWKKP
ncbi:MAG: cob(I)yrinic acid a,c-diamide adenosyltransferase [Tepidisphaeraceae bacterium]|jgi:cob(I)alamin adenosyltransferase